MRRHLPLLTLAAVNAILAVVATYAALRAYDVLFKSEPDPATVAGSVHVAMFWRLAVGAYVGGMVAMLVWALGRRNLPATLRVTAALVPVVGAMIALQGAMLP